ncbi:MAG: glycosyltransferase family 2 protein [Verrucomicrobiae bacterium]|nr:glycosyltransferase family 2 protein [Verrucomicrobiae bacterium]
MISVVIPLYNKSQHIERALLSIKNQYLRPFEVIVVDDGSTDGGGLIVKNFKMERIRLISQENLGVSAARNRGLVEAKTDYVAFLDADDEWLPNHLSAIVQLIEKFPEKGFYSTLHFVKDGNELRSPRSPFPVKKKNHLVENFFDDFSIGFSLVNSSTAVVSKIIALYLGGFPENIRRGEDIVLWIKIFLNSGMAHTSMRTAIYHRDAVNRSNILRDKEPPGSLVYLSHLIGSSDLPNEFVISAKRLFEKIAFFTAAGMKISGDEQGFYGICSLSQRNGYKKLFLLLRILEHIPLRALVWAQRFRHSPA